MFLRHFILIGLVNLSQIAMAETFSLIQADPVGDNLVIRTQISTGQVQYGDINGRWADAPPVDRDEVLRSIQWQRTQPRFEEIPVDMKPTTPGQTQTYYYSDTGWVYRAHITDDPDALFYAIPYTTEEAHGYNYRFYHRRYRHIWDR